MKNVSNHNLWNSRNDSLASGSTSTFPIFSLSHVWREDSASQQGNKMIQNEFVYLNLWLHKLFEQPWCLAKVINCFFLSVGVCHIPLHHMHPNLPLLLTSWLRYFQRCRKTPWREHCEAVKIVLFQLFTLWHHISARTLFLSSGICMLQVSVCVNHAERFFLCFYFAIRARSEKKGKYWICSFVGCRNQVTTVEIQ